MRPLSSSSRTATVRSMRSDLFGENPRCFCDIAEADGQPVGFALWCYNYSTFRGRAGIYLEDLFVKPEARGLGAGKALLKRLAERCMEFDLGRLEWAVAGHDPPLRWGTELHSRPKRRTACPWELRIASGVSPPTPPSAPATGRCSTPMD